MARKFTFNLQKYLDYKESIVNGKAADLLKSKKLLDKENDKLEKLFEAPVGDRFFAQTCL